MRPETHLADATSIVGASMASQLLNAARQGIALQSYPMPMDNFNRHWVSLIGRIDPSQIPVATYMKMIEHAKTNELQLVVSHLPNGLYKPSPGFCCGYAEKLWNEQNAVLIQGRFYDTRLGHEAFSAIYNDNQPLHPIRVSIAYWEPTGQLLHLSLTRVPAWRDTEVKAWRTYRT